MAEDVAQQVGVRTAQVGSEGRHRVVTHDARLASEGCLHPSPRAHTGGLESTPHRLLDKGGQRVSIGAMSKGHGWN
jgi:hypothetical protein